MKKIIIIILPLMATVFLFAKKYPVEYTTAAGDTNPEELITYIQSADLAGVATILSTDAKNWTIKVDVKEWWLGSLSSNRFEIGNANLPVENYEEFSPFSEYGWDPAQNIGRDIVFYVVTNVWKYNSSPFPGQFDFDWNRAQTFTNFGAVCPPVFMPKHTPPVFLLETNSTHTLNIMSNITQSIFFTRNKIQLYRALSEARRLGGNEIPIYMRWMTWYPIMTLGREATEPMLVELLNDPLLYPLERTNSLIRLKQKYNWSPTNTVPFP